MKTKNILIILGIIILIVFIYFYQKPKEIKNPNEEFITVRLYDKNNNTYNITGEKSLSTVQGVPGILNIDFVIKLTNSGTVPLSCTPITISPSVFNTAVTKTTKQVAGGKSISWTSSLMSASQFESANPVRFSATIKCSYNLGQQQTFVSPDASGFVDLNIIANTVGSFQVSLIKGGIPSEWCGDLVCNSGENTEICPGDCPPVTHKVIWRTHISTCGYTDWTNANDQWVAFDADNNVLTPLKPFGQTSTYSITTRNTDNFAWFTSLGGTSPCGLSLMGEGTATQQNGPYDLIYAINIDGSHDIRFDEDQIYTTNLGVEPCCGVTCGACCERYDDGTSNC